MQALLALYVCKVSRKNFQEKKKFLIFKNCFENFFLKICTHEDQVKLEFWQKQFFENFEN